MARERIKVEIHHQDRPGGITQKSAEADVRRQVTVSRLIEETKRKFRLQGNFQLYIKDTGKVLNPSLTLAQLGISSDISLGIAKTDEGSSSNILDKIEQILSQGNPRPEKINTSPDQYYLQDIQGNPPWPISWQPAIIGRKNQDDPIRNILIAVDVGNGEEAKFTSRYHACITFEEGYFYIYGINRRNPTYLNGQMLRYAERKSLGVGNKVRVGKIEFQFMKRSSLDTESHS